MADTLREALIDRITSLPEWRQSGYSGLKDAILRALSTIPAAEPAEREPTRSQKLREAGFTRRPSPPGKMAGGLWKDPEDASPDRAQPPAQPASIPSFRDDDLVRIGKGNISTTMYAREWFDAAAREGASQPAQVEPLPGLLMSMAIRYDHALGLPGYYDQPLMARGGLTHQQRLESALRTMRQLWEEVVGRGFYKPEKEADYAALAALPASQTKP